MFKYLAQPLPSHSPRGLEHPLLFFSISPTTPTPFSALSISPSFSLTAANVNGRGSWTAGWDAGAGLVEGKSERRGGEAAIVGLDSTLSPLEHPLTGDLLTIEHLNLIMQMPTSKSNTL